MKLFIQVSFDLENADKKAYDSLEVGLGQNGLSRIIDGPANRQIRLPRRQKLLRATRFYVRRSFCPKTKMGTRPSPSS